MTIDYASRLLKKSPSEFLIVQCNEKKVTSNEQKLTSNKQKVSPRYTEAVVLTTLVTGYTNMSSAIWLRLIENF